LKSDKLKSGLQILLFMLLCTNKTNYSVQVVLRLMWLTGGGQGSFWHSCAN